MISFFFFFSFLFVLFRVWPRPVLPDLMIQLVDNISISMSLRVLVYHAQYTHKTSV